MPRPLLYYFYFEKGIFFRYEQSKRALFDRILQEMIKFMYILIHILKGTASGINLDLSVSRNHEIRFDLTRLTVFLLHA